MCNCPAHFGLVDCTCRCDRTADRMFQWRARAEALAATVQRVRDLHSQDTSLLAAGEWCPACGDETPCPTIRALAAPSDPATDTGGEGRG